RRHTRCLSDWSSDVCSSDLFRPLGPVERRALREARGEALESVPWTEDLPLICTVARLSPQKGLFDLVEAAELMIKQLPELKLVVIGRASCRERGEMAEVEV